MEITRRSALGVIGASIIAPTLMLEKSKAKVDDVIRFVVNKDNRMIIAMPSGNTFLFSNGTDKYMTESRRISGDYDDIDRFGDKWFDLVQEDWDNADLLAVKLYSIINCEYYERWKHESRLKEALKFNFKLENDESLLVLFEESLNQPLSP